MSETLRPRRGRGLVSVLFAVAAAAAACGDSSTESSADEPITAGDDTAEEVADGGLETDPADPADPADPVGDGDGDGDDEAAVENLFPDLDVVDIDDGSTVNLAAELGGGDTPVLLWFWAPH